MIFTSFFQGNSQCAPHTSRITRGFNVYVSRVGTSSALSIRETAANLTSHSAWRYNGAGRGEGATRFTSCINDAALVSQSLQSLADRCRSRWTDSRPRDVGSIQIGWLSLVCIKSAHNAIVCISVPHVLIFSVSLSGFQGENEGILAVARPGKCWLSSPPLASPPRLFPSPRTIVTRALSLRSSR